MPTFETERLILRPWTVDDAEDAFAIFGNPEVTQWLGGSGFPDRLEQMPAIVERWQARYEELGKQGFGFWASESKETGRVVGGTVLKPLPADNNMPTEEIEVGWYLAPPHWGRGYATEAASRIVQYALEELALPEIYAIVKPGNHRSVAVTTRLGMQPLGRTTKYYDRLEADLFRRTQ